MQPARICVSVANAAALHLAVLLAQCCWGAHAADASLYGGNSDVVELNADTFDAAVFAGGSGDAAAHLVEFYMHTCGHCRAFAPVYDQFATSVRQWAAVARVAAVNCALAKNGDLCKDNNVLHVPYLKYFGRRSRAAGDGKVLQRLSASETTIEKLRKVFMEHITDEHKSDANAAWPPLQFAPSSESVQDMWSGTSLDSMALVFDDTFKPNTYSFQAVIDVWRRAGSRASVRRVSHSSRAAAELGGPRSPAVWVLRRGEPMPVYTHTPDARDTAALSSMAQRALERTGLQLQAAASTTAVTMPPTTTADEMARRARYFVSETDMLLAMRFALVTEMVLQQRVISGARFDTLKRFVHTLAQNFPIAASNAEKQRKLGLSVPRLPRSVRARRLFADLAAWLDGPRYGRFTQDEWKAHFEHLEAAHGRPFPTGSDWVHCKGSDVRYRGYTCGLWTTFHAMSVQTLLAHVNDTGYPAVSDAQHGRDLVESIRGWVTDYFSCSHCASHFYNMTTRIIPVDTWMHSPETTVTYLWRAHNMVNGRLSGDATDDPSMPKVQYPPAFVCGRCHYDAGGTWNMQHVLDYLIRYYTDIRPHEHGHGGGDTAHFAVPDERS